MTTTPPPVNASASFWDVAEHRPPVGKLEVGDSLTGRVERLALETSMFDRGKMQLTFTINGQQRWASGRLWTALFKARVEEGDHVTITRLPDEDRLGPGGHPITNWQILKYQPGVEPTPSVPAQPDPSFEW